MKYRIVKRTLGDGEIYYKVQERHLFFWFDVSITPIIIKDGGIKTVGQIHNSLISALEEKTFLEGIVEANKVIKEEVV